MIRLIIILALFLLAIFVFRYLMRRLTKISFSDKKRIVGVILLGIVVLLTATGRLHWLLTVLGGIVVLGIRLLPNLLRYLPLIHRLWAQYQPLRSPSKNDGYSSVEAEYIHMRLNRDSGEIDGKIVKGRYAGKSLGDLDKQSLLRLLRECQEYDEDSSLLLETYLDRIYGEDWHNFEDKDQSTRSSDVKMSEEEARSILGVAVGASREEIIETHRRFIQKNHPDRGGSNYLAAKINQAKDVLLGKQ